MPPRTNYLGQNVDEPKPVTPPQAPGGFDVQAFIQAYFQNEMQRAQMEQQGQMAQTQLKRDMFVPQHKTNLMSGDQWADTFGGPQEGSRSLTYGPGMSDGRTPPSMPDPAQRFDPSAAFGLDVNAMAPMGPGGMPIEDPDVLLARNKAMARPGGMSRYRQPQMF